ncbi:DUF3742 family protein [Pseudomonas aeruginosa]|uniref:DUF3742 family protein n=1 Tax=Pseudomonas aeruginosa TaxID=287 RepID=UPI000F7F5E95|nr:DUF3742 family protein [Pseudomonas aeruginosa]RTB44146.1 DUF3742 family protein [Pseudomonas aeruginosa]
MTAPMQQRWTTRFGWKLGQVWRGYVRRERSAAGWLVAQGVPAGGAKVLSWLVRLAVLGVLFYVGFWFVLLLVVVVAVWAAAGGHDSEPDEWQFMSMDRPQEFFGYDPNTHNDASHSNYEED